MIALYLFSTAWAILGATHTGSVEKQVMYLYAYLLLIVGSVGTGAGQSLHLTVRTAIQIIQYVNVENWSTFKTRQIVLQSRSFDDFSRNRQTRAGVSSRGPLATLAAIYCRHCFIPLDRCWRLGIDCTSTYVISCVESLFGARTTARRRWSRLLVLTMAVDNPGASIGPSCSLLMNQS